jgi:hypothetical protein
MTSKRRRRSDRRRRKETIALVLKASWSLFLENHLDVVEKKLKQGQFKLSSHDLDTTPRQSKERGITAVSIVVTSTQLLRIITASNQLKRKFSLCWRHSQRRPSQEFITISNESSVISWKASSPRSTKTNTKLPTRKYTNNLSASSQHKFDHFGSSFMSRRITPILKENFLSILSRPHTMTKTTR